MPTSAPTSEEAAANLDVLTKLRESDFQPQCQTNRVGWLVHPTFGDAFFVFGTRSTLLSAVAHVSFWSKSVRGCLVAP
jgi:hypothetical protein